MKKAKIQQKADFAKRGKINSFNMAKKSEDVAVFYLGQEGRDAGIVPILDEHSYCPLDRKGKTVCSSIPNFDKSLSSVFSLFMFMPLFVGGRFHCNCA